VLRNIIVVAGTDLYNVAEMAELKNSDLGALLNHYHAKFVCTPPTLRQCVPLDEMTDEHESANTHDQGSEAVLQIPHV
jgi:hypothetical protein